MIDAEQGLHSLVPARGNVVRLEAAVDQLLLDAVAQDHVRRVGQLVRVDADEAGLDAVVEADEVVGGERRVVAEGAAELAAEEADERRRAVSR